MEYEPGNDGLAPKSEENKNENNSDKSNDNKPLKKKRKSKNKPFTDLQIENVQQFSLDKINKNDDLLENKND